MDVLSVFKNSGSDALTMAEFLKSSGNLEAQAREAAPWKIEDCTFNQGHVRQPVFSCLTCKEATGVPAGICATCSITCHSEHEQVELFSRRHFQCDCGTTRLGEQAVCNAGKRLGQPPNEGNRYDACFDNTFCICGHQYDPQTEEDEMLQCVVCENWLHSKCILPPAPDKKDTLALDLDDFDALVCGHCSTKSGTAPIWAKYAGHNGVMLVDDAGQTHGKMPITKIDASESPQKKEKVDEKQKGFQTASEAGTREEVDKADEEPPAKKLKTAEADEEPVKAGEAADNTAEADESRCSAPAKAADMFSELAQTSKRFATSLFLQEAWRDRFCRCAQCLPMFKDYPYLLEEEEDVDLAEDDEPTKSISEIADQHLNNLPRAQAAEVSNRIVELRESFLKFVNGLPANTDGSDVTVDKSMVEGWMEKLKQQQRSSQ